MRALRIKIFGTDAAQVFQTQLTGNYTACICITVGLFYFIMKSVFSAYTCIYVRLPSYLTLLDNILKIMLAA